ncbi:hypothetical protein GVO57_14265 (plasmid) [Sphingomonas changnyeongensis]|uniref:Uncharacterized protein n=1 Tax=Sphingomonas changnyeongensis TaxID=2698679 RepID=A0A7Z2NYA8_9SPHN|nr:hypothetical protein [Sphingomonas changnyeongensis]QHL92046.1 hypothetical protein GVO57_14265 [Sphingomonas changnyeongensis]
MGNTALNVAKIMDRLHQSSRRPRYAYMVLSLLAEQADQGGKVGPSIIDDDKERLTLRDYVSKRLAKLSGYRDRRRQLEQRVRAELAGKLPQDLFEAQAIVDRHVEERARQTSAANFSRVLTELEKAGFVNRFYQGYRTNHANRGAQRHLVCVLDGDVSAALRSRDRFI